MHIGQSVYVCYDGKWGRRQTGVVIAIRAQQVQVQFNEYANDDNVLTSWFYRRDRNQEIYGAYVRVERSLMRALFGAPGDWYTVFDKRDIDETI